MFVLDGQAEVEVGDVVRVLAGVTEFETSGGASSLTELTGVSGLEVCGEASLPTPATEALVDWLATDPTGSGDADTLIMVTSTATTRRTRSARSATARTTCLGPTTT